MTSIPFIEIKLVIFIILGTCISFTAMTDLPIINEIKNIYMLVKPDDDFHEYRSLNRDRSLDKIPYKHRYYNYTKLLSEKEFYETFYNLDSRRIPKKTYLENYEEYLDEFQNFCRNTFTSYNGFLRKNQFKLFLKGVIELNQCLNITESADSLGTKLEQCSGKDKEEKNAKVKCLLAILSDEEAMKLHSCMSDFIETTKISVKVLKKLKKDEDSMKLPVEIGKDPEKRSNGRPISILDFVGNYPNIYKNEEEKRKAIQKPKYNKLNVFSQKEYNFLNKFIKYANVLDSSNINSMFDEYTTIEPVRNVEELRKKCLKYKMSSKEYTTIQILYKVLPEHTDNYNSFIAKINYFVSYMKKLNANFKNDHLLYNALQENIKFINIEYFMKLIERRAIKKENIYELYALRLLMKDYLPLSKKLWKKERNYLIKFREEIQMEVDHVKMGK